MTNYSRGASTRFQKRLLVGLAVVLVVSSIAVAIDTDDAVLNATLFYRSNVLPRGYDTIRNEDTDVLSEGGTMTYTLSLYRNTNYALFACGEDTISDLDIYLYDENENLIDRDRLLDRCPWVFVTPRWSGKFYLVVKNYDGARGAYHMAVAF